MKKLVIFDLDGTLLDTVEDLAAACNHILGNEGYPLYPVDQYRIFVGNGISKLIERAVPPEARTAEHIEELRLRFIDYYTKHIDERTHPYSGISEMLNELNSMGIKLAVASNKFHDGTVSLVSRFFPKIPFAAIFGQRAGIPTKPDPAVVDEIIAIAGVCSDEVLYVGDSDVDMLTAQNAGVESVGVVWGFRGEKELAASGADYIVDSPDEAVLIAGK